MMLESSQAVELIVGLLPKACRADYQDPCSFENARWCSRGAPSSDESQGLREKAEYARCATRDREYDLLNDSRPGGTVRSAILMAHHTHSNDPVGRVFLHFRFLYRYRPSAETHQDWRVPRSSCSLVPLGNTVPYQGPTAAWLNETKPSGRGRSKMTLLSLQFRPSAATAISASNRDAGVSSVDDSTVA